jgi:hypothetical protein
MRWLRDTIGCLYAMAVPVANIDQPQDPVRPLPASVAEWGCALLSCTPMGLAGLGTTGFDIDLERCHRPISGRLYPQRGNIGECAESVVR